MSKTLCSRPKWKSQPLAELCEFSSGLWKGKRPPYRNVAVIRNTNFNADGTLNDSDIAYLDVEESQFANRSLQYGDIILEKSGGGPKQAVGRVILFDKEEGDYSFSNFTSRVRSVDVNKLSPSYLHRYLYWIYISGITENLQTHSTGIRNLDLSAYKDLVVSYPCPTEQNRICSIIDDVLEGIATASASALKNTHKVKEAIERHRDRIFLSGLATNRRNLLGELASFRNGVNFTKSSRGKRVQIVGVKDFQDRFSVPMNNLDLVTIDGEIKSEDILRTGDLLTVRSNGNIELIGRTMVTKECPENTLHSGFTIRTRLEVETILPQYLCHFMRWGGTRRGLIDGGIGVNIKSLNQRALSDLQVPVPSLPEQQRITEQLDERSREAERLQFIYKQKLVALVELRNSVLRQAFCGDL
jgi:type I restriction enzyme S subunit